MELRKLIINGLFGHFNHVVEFKDENITIITAPNGYGKTICLKVIDAVFNRKILFLGKLQFASVEVHTSDGTLTIEKVRVASNTDADVHTSDDTLAVERDMENTLDTVSLNYIDTEGQNHTQNLNPLINEREFIRGIGSYIPFLRRTGPREWEDRRTDEIYTYDEIVERYREEIPDRFITENYDQWYSDFSDSLNVHFIQDQRLIQRETHNRRSRRGFIDTIEKYSNELSELIRESGVESSDVSQRLDTTFPERLLKENSDLVPMEAEILQTELEALQLRRSALLSFNLLSSTEHLAPIPLDEIKSGDTKVLTLYVQDTKEKLAPYDDIYKKIELFSRILNNKRLSFKKIKIDSNKGFHFETDDESPLKLTQLSSGEQHQVVLLYELIFKTGNNVLVLIDEPEISLHVAWQKEFLEDLKEIIQIQNMPVVIATHSPQIINNNWELTVNLKEGDEIA